MKKKILIFINYYGKTSETFISDEIDFLFSQDNIDIEVLHYGTDILDKNIRGLMMPSSTIERWKKQLNRLNYPKLKSLQYRNGINGSLFYLIDFFKNNKYDAIYCHFGTNGKLIAELKELGVVNNDTKLVVRFHGLDLNFAKYKYSYYGILKKQGNTILFGTKMAKDKLLKYGFNNQLVYLPVGIKQKNIINETAFLEKTREVFSKFKILSIGRFIELKGHNIAIDIIESLNSHNIVLNIIGDGPLQENISDSITDKGLESKIILNGNQPHDVVFSFLNKCQLYLYSGIYDSEGRCENQATSVLEAMAQGNVVLVSSIGGITDYVKNGETGFVCEPGNTKQFGEQLEWIIKNYQSNTLIEIQRNAIKLIQSNYVQEELNCKLLKILTS